MQPQSSGGSWGGSSMQSSGFMGGSPGDGLQGSWPGAPTSQPQLMGSNFVGHQDVMNQRPAGATAAVYSPGSITQYAPQVMSSAGQPTFHNQSSMHAQQQQQQLGQQQLAQQQQAYVASSASLAETRPVIQSNMTAPGNTSGSYAARSAHAYASTGASIVAQQVPLPLPPPSSAILAPSSATVVSDLSSTVNASQQDRILTDCTRRVQEHAYYMRHAMELDDLATVLERASYMVGELGGAHGQPAGGGDSHLLTPKSYYELHIRALEEMPNLEEYFANKSQQQQQQPTATLNYNMLQLYEVVQFCPQVLSRVYLQICAGSALIRSKEVGAKWVLNDIAAVTRCVQNPTRGLFLRHFLLQAFRDKLPNQPVTDAAAATTPAESSMMEVGTVQDAYQFVLSNFVEMNKLWVRLQHLPGEGKSKEQRKRRERERNDLRVLVGMNLVRLSQLEGVTSRIYGEVVLPEILGQIVACADPLAQAYLMDCIIQVFPDEYHIETLPILLSVCPKLRDKVNIRTILQSLMDRLSNYYAEEELLDENDCNQVKKSLARDSLPLFEECVQNVYNARGPKLTCKEVIRLQTALLNFSLKSSPGNMEQFDHCLQTCVVSLRQAVISYNVPEGTVVNLPTDSNQIVLDEISAGELDKLLTLVIDTLALSVLELKHFPVLVSFLPWQNRELLAVAMLRSVVQASVSFQGVKEVHDLFNVISPSFERPVAPTQVSGFGPTTQVYSNLQQNASPDNDVNSFLLARLVHLLNHADSKVAYDMLLVARSRLSTGQQHVTHRSLVALVFSALRLADDLCTEVHDNEAKKSEPENEVRQQSEDETSGPIVHDDSSPVVGLEDIKKEEDKSTCTESKNVGNDMEGKEDIGKDDATISIRSTDSSGADIVPGSNSGAPPANEKQVIQADGKQVTQDSLSFRKLFVFVQQTISMVALGNAENGFKLYMQAILAGERFACRQNQTFVDLSSFEPIAVELFTQAFTLYDESVSDPTSQNRCIASVVGCLLATQSLSRSNYDMFVTRTAQLAARTHKRQEQCQFVALCANLFFPIGRPHIAEYSNPQRALECLQRALKLADACTSSNPTDVRLFVDLLDQYLFFFEHNNPVISDTYIIGLISLIREHFQSMGTGPNAIWDAKEQFQEIIRYIKRKKEDSITKDRFSAIQVDF